MKSSRGRELDRVAANFANEINTLADLQLVPVYFRASACKAGKFSFLLTFLQPQRYTESAIKKSLLLGHSSLDLAPQLAGPFIRGMAYGAESPGIRLTAKARRERFRLATT